jgi:hypothetical protein
MAVVGFFADPMANRKSGPSLITAAPLYAAATAR